MTHKTENQENEKVWVMSILSDAQEELSIGNVNLAHDKINDAKRVLLGRYDIQEDGSICIIRGRIKPSNIKIKMEQN